MKFTKSILIFIAFSCLLAFTQLANLNKNQTSNLNEETLNKNQTSSRTEEGEEGVFTDWVYKTVYGEPDAIPKLKETIVFQTGNPWGNYFAGALEAILGGDQKVYKCIPAEYQTKVQFTPTPQDAAYQTNNLGNVNTVITVFRHLLDKMVDVLCKFRHSVVTFLSQIFIKPALGQQASTTSFFLEKASYLKNSKGYKSLIHNSAYMRNKGLFDFKSSWDRIVTGNSYFREWFRASYNNIKVSVVSFINWLKDIYGRVSPILECGNILKTEIVAAKDIFDKIKSKISYFRTAFTSPVPNVQIVATIDILTGLICQKDNFYKAYEYVQQAYLTQDVKLKWLYFGRTTGYFFRGLIKTETLGEKLVEFTNQVLSNLFSY